MSISASNKMATCMAVTDQGAVCVSLAGDVDLAAEPDLASLADNLAAMRCSVVHIDLGKIRFAGSSLVKFLFRLAGPLPGPTTINLCRPDAMTLQLIQLTGLHEVATVRPDLPADWVALCAAAVEPHALQTTAG
jgi:anti-anti-sigma factor